MDFQTFTASIAFLPAQVPDKSTAQEKTWRPTVAVDVANTSNGPRAQVGAIYQNHGSDRDSPLFPFIAPGVVQSDAPGSIATANLSVGEQFGNRLDAFSQRFYRHRNRILCPLVLLADIALLFQSHAGGL